MTIIIINFGNLILKLNNFFVALQAPTDTIIQKAIFTSQLNI